MKQLYLLLFFMISATFIWAQTELYPKGYLHTKNNYKLTGTIGRVDHGTEGSKVLFVNDFGTPYSIHPQLIKGFAFVNEGVMTAYESKYWDGHWMFLSVSYAGDNVRLLKTPDKILDLSLLEATKAGSKNKIKTYWIELPGHRIQPVKKWGFKRQMKRLTRDIAPKLAKQIGKKGYRYKNLVTILEIYDVEWSKGKRRL